jgi:hypothetical protein
MRPKALGPATVASSTELRGIVWLVSGAHDGWVDPRGDEEILRAGGRKSREKLVAPEGGHGSSAVETMKAPLLAWIERVTAGAPGSLTISKRKATTLERGVRLPK